MEIRYQVHPDDFRRYDTNQVREKFLVEKIFAEDDICLVYSHADRIIFGGIMPVNKVLSLNVGNQIRAEYFLERRELGIINIGGNGVVSVDGISYELANKDGLYIGMGARVIEFSSKDSNKPAKFFICSTPAHTSYPTVKIEIIKANPVKLGDVATANRRTIYQYVHPAVCKSCQLTMGLTVLEPGSVWNTMPPHTHERRSEVYFYFDLGPNDRVFHFIGLPSETKHIVVANEQAVISPSWSIHSGVGTRNYAFIWCMAGENQKFDDMDAVPMEVLR
ncbi:5-dehydro-4-deoxy-D-glucuronate isomerase [Pseudothermotoga thermarum]|uniref:4-deoxy-L-threo-5-hexosulose-uronate ketol-isomerase n=1 Tax=Pseudothermotoga thermarum DSM 5069 TaxID=688269 RepID=F7YW06_9THEM|nr:5-dehydro-4-deoxy-D-glucuronate isomerase [Pseudothermotoga thermarum]AEH50493.1 4-deoxy-L-threo-5-hexulose uronate isomerase [Pseudothermotoga thermarum DSM 5069]